MLNEIEQFNLTKSGQQVLMLSLSRSSKGLILKVKAHSSIEDFFQTISQGMVEPVALHGRWWRPVGGAELSSVYQVKQQIRAPFDGRGQFYTLNAVGQDLLTIETPGAVITARNPFGDGDDEPAAPRGGTGQQLNISFLRLQGISEGEGVAISVPTVQTAEALRKMATQLRTAVKQFYVDFLKPLDVTIIMSTQETNR